MENIGERGSSKGRKHRRKQSSALGTYEIFQFGERGAGFLPCRPDDATDAKGIQDFEDIQRKCKASGLLFEDPWFRCTHEVLYVPEPGERRVPGHESTKGEDVEWLRPKVKSCFEFRRRTISTIRGWNSDIFRVPANM